LHEVNEACTLISNATENQEVQINFGVVQNEAMGDEVKITVIATGFERESLPSIPRRNQAGEPAVAPPPAIESEPPQMTRIEPELGPFVDPEPAANPMYAEMPEPDPAFDHPMAAAAHANGSPEPIFDDLDVPAILRRRMVQ